jgi:hypothetical protein
MISKQNVLHIPEELIEECERLSEQTNGVHFIFDTYSQNWIETTKYVNKDEQREYILGKVFDDEEEVERLPLCIGCLSDLKDMPSRFIYYDTETKQTDKYKRYKYVTDFLVKIGFEPSENNLGQEYEQVFYLMEKIENGEVKVNLRINQNLLINLSYTKTHYVSGGTSGGTGNVYSGFFTKEKVLNSLLKLIPFFNKSFVISKVREYNLSTILTD